MYKLVYNYKESEKDKVLVEKEYFFGDTFRLKKNAVHYLLEIIQNEFRNEGYATEQVSGGALYCIKTDITAERKRVVVEWKISVKKI